MSEDRMALYELLEMALERAQKERRKAETGRIGNIGHEAKKDVKECSLPRYPDNSLKVYWG